MQSLHDLPVVVSVEGFIVTLIYDLPFGSALHGEREVVALSVSAVCFV